MAEHSRYNVSGNEEILANKLGIIDQKRIENIEILLLRDAYAHFGTLLEQKKLKFKVKLIFEIHHYFLNTLYAWAGKIRTVEISKGGILFCPSSQIKNALADFERIVKNYVPSSTDNKKNLSKNLAVIHCEFNAIHPFREGNGRTIRLFLDLLATKNSYNLIDYSKTSQPDYIKACIAGMQQDYSKMQKVLYNGLSEDK